MLKRLPVWLFAVLVMAIAACSVVQAAPVPLSDLLQPGATYTSGDKIFSDFTYVKTGDMPGPENITVGEIQIDGNFGIRFQGGFIDQAGGDASDALITFNVSVPLNSNMLISDAHLYANPAVFAGEGLASVTETFLPIVQEDKLVVYDFGNGNDQLADMIVFDQGYATLPVQKDIILHAIGNGAVTMSFVDQTFSQIPEPSTAAMLALGLLSVGCFRRRVR
jgi:hypothetical protein